MLHQWPGGLVQYILCFYSHAYIYSHTGVFPGAWGLQVEVCKILWGTGRKYREKVLLWVWESHGIIGMPIINYALILADLGVFDLGHCPIILISLSAVELLLFDAWWKCSYWPQLTNNPGHVFILNMKMMDVGKSLCMRVKDRWPESSSLAGSRS